MVDDIRRLLAYEMTLAEWIGLGVLAGLPYLLVGVVWSCTQYADLTAWSFVGSVASWPVLVVSECAT